MSSITCPQVAGRETRVHSATSRLATPLCAAGPHSPPEFSYAYLTCYLAK